MTAAPSIDGDDPPVPSAQMPSETLAEAVARAAAGLTNMTLAKRAGLSTRTLREILNPASTRHFGRATLDKLDVALGWPHGRAWQLYLRHQSTDTAALPSELLDSIHRQMELLGQRLDEFHDEPLWAAQLIEACKRLSDSDRAFVLAMAYRLNDGRSSRPDDRGSG